MRGDSWFLAACKLSAAHFGGLWLHSGWDGWLVIVLGVE